MNISTKHMNLLATGALVVGLGMASAASALGNHELGHGYQVAVASVDSHKAAEGKCGEGKCGASKGKQAEGKCGEGKCGATKGKQAEGKCGEGKCGADKGKGAAKAAGKH